MKKCLMVLAASTLIMFAACKKEDKGYTINGNQITFGVGLDTRTDDSKQSFNGEYKRIYFTTGDQMIVNDAPYSVIPKASENFPGSSSAFSPVGRVTVDVNPSGAYNFIYPAAIFAENAGQYNATFPAEVNLLNGKAANNDFNLIPEAVRPIWPMAFGIEDITSFEGNVILKNATSFVSPNFIYGPAWCNAAFSRFTNVLYGTDINTNVTISCPVLTVTDVVIRSSKKLTGAAHLDMESPEFPKMVMNSSISGTTRDVVVCHAPENTIVSENLATSQELQNVAGILPVPPMGEGTKKFQMNVYLECDLDVANYTETVTSEGTVRVYDGTTTSTHYYIKFVTNEQSITEPLVRAKRHMMNINFQTIGNGINGTYTVNDDGSITFPNGKLYMQTTRFTVE